MGRYSAQGGPATVILNSLFDILRFNRTFQIISTAPPIRPICYLPTTARLPQGIFAHQPSQQADLAGVEILMVGGKLQSPQPRLEHRVGLGQRLGQLVRIERW